MSAPRKSFLRRRWWQLLIVLVVCAGIGVWWAARVAAARWEPFAREQFIAYLEERYKAKVEIGRLDVSVPVGNPIQFLIDKGRGKNLRLAVSDLKVIQRDMEDLPPLLTMDSVAVTVDFPTLFEDTVMVREVRLDGFQFTIPPKGRRGRLTDRTQEIASDDAPGSQPDAATPGEGTPDGEPQGPSVIIEEIVADGMRLTILPGKPEKAPLVFDMKTLRLFHTAPGAAMRYKAELTNPKPPGLINSEGSFGPFNVDEPGDSSLGGDYTFQQADLSVFRGITGTLNSTGKFSGQLNRIVADGVSDTPDFGLSYSKNRIRLQTKYHAVIDGTNGDTELRPVEAMIGSTKLVCEGAVERYPGENGKTVALKVQSKEGNLEDILTLAMKDSNLPLAGKLTLDINLKVPPGKQDYADRLEVSGKFLLNDGQFSNKETRDKLNDMSSRATGNPNEEPDDDVTTDFDGEFVLTDRVLNLSKLRFLIPGAEVNLDGSFNLGTDVLDFHGILRTDAKLSQMMKSRWKRWALKPVDPFFSKDGAGAQFNIAITGSRDNPNFGLDRGRK
ncbi:MAG: hypothetical protein KIT83_05655 [Bryobacterales bacterium]|nr:hypothetical protein [Bryobacterales bacterium]